MTDTDIVAACAKAMDMDFIVSFAGHVMTRPRSSLLSYSQYYWPLSNDNEAVALVKAFGINQWWGGEKIGWRMMGGPSGDEGDSWDFDWNRAVCKCVAKMQGEKKSSNAKVRGDAPLYGAAFGHIFN